MNSLSFSLAAAEIEGEEVLSPSLPSPKAASADGGGDGGRECGATLVTVAESLEAVEETMRVGEGDKNYKKNK